MPVFVCYGNCCFQQLIRENKVSFYSVYKDNEAIFLMLVLLVFYRRQKWVRVFIKAITQMLTFMLLTPHPIIDLSTGTIKK